MRTDVDARETDRSSTPISSFVFAVDIKINFKTYVITAYDANIYTVKDESDTPLTNEEHLL